MQSTPERAWVVLFAVLLIAAGDQFQRLVLTGDVRSLQAGLHLSNAEFGGLFTTFLIAFNAGSLIGGLAAWLAPVRWVMLGAVGLTAAGALMCSQASSAEGMLPGRAVFGLGSAIVAVSAYRALAEWLPRHFHGTAVALFRGVFVALGIGSTVLVTPIVQRMGWRVAFTAVAVWGVLLAAVWVVSYLPRSAAGRATDTLRDGEAGLVSPVSWALIGGLVLIAPLQVFVFNWLPLRLQMALHLPDSFLRIPMIVSLVALLAAGLITDLAIQQGARAGRSRGVALIVAGVMMAAIALLGAATNPIAAIVILSIVMAGFQAWSVILYSAVLDAVPPGGVALATGIAAMLAAVMQSATSSGFGRFLRDSSYGSTAILIAFLVLVATSMAALVWRIPPESGEQPPTTWQPPPYSGYPPPPQ